MSYFLDKTNPYNPEEDSDEEETLLPGLS